MLRLPALPVVSLVLFACHAGCAPAPDDGGEGEGEPDTTTIRIDFEELTAGDLVTDQYGPAVVFESLDPGRSLVVIDTEGLGNRDEGGVGPNIICVGAGETCTTADMRILLNADLVSLTFNLPAGGIQSVDNAGTLQLQGGDPDDFYSDPLAVGVQTFDDMPAGCREVRFVAISDANGIGWDDFSFTVLR